MSVEYEEQVSSSGFSVCLVVLVGVAQHGLQWNVLIV